MLVKMRQQTSLCFVFANVNTEFR